MINFKKVREEIAKKYNLTLDKKDPVPAAVTLNQLILESYIQLISDHSSQEKKEITDALRKQVTQSKETAGRIITQTANSVSEEMKQTLNSTISEYEFKFKNHTNEILKKIEDMKAKDYENTLEVSHSLKKCILFSMAISVISLIIAFFLIIITIII